MTAILAASVSIRTLADGTLRLSVDIKPRDAQAAFALFGKPGSAVGLARITPEAAVEHDRKAQAAPAEPKDRKPVSLASKVALTCREMSFHDFLRRRKASIWADALTQHGSDRPGTTDGETIAKFAVRDICAVASRSEITVGSPAALTWGSLEADYLDWQRNAGRAA